MLLAEGGPELDTMKHRQAPEKLFARESSSNGQDFRRYSFDFTSFLLPSVVTTSSPQ